MNSGNDSASTSTTPERWTIKRLLDWTTHYFREHGSDRARLDAEILLAEALHCPRIQLYTRFDEEPDASVKATFRDWVARHADGEPVAYLVGYREFFSLKFLVNSSVMIPRPETEHLVSEALDALKEMESTEPPRVIDIGTGSGCVAISICNQHSAIEMTASDRSEAALEVARRNAETHRVSDRIRFLHSDLFSDIPPSERFHLIVSNPPYIGQLEKPDLDRSVVDFEPHQALFAEGPRGTETIERLIDESVDRLLPGGWLMFEISPMIAESCRAIIEKQPSLTFQRTVNDLAGLQRLIIARRTH